jgi:O-antigen/teichoic acid export membrane protein
MAQQSADNPPTGAPASAHGSYRSGFAFGILSFATVVVFGVVSTIATARIYGVRIIGEFALVSAPVAALWVLSTAKEQAALIREITALPARHPRITHLFAAVFTFSTGLTILVSSIVAAISVVVFRGPLHHPELVAPMLVSLAGYALVTNSGWNIDSIFSAFVAGRQLFWVRLHETLSFIVIAVAIGLAWQSVWGLVIATIGASFTALIHRAAAVQSFARARVDRAGYREGMKALPDLLRFGLKVTPGGIADGVSQQVGIWAIGIVSPLALVGAYSRAQTIPDRLQQVNFRIVEVLYPTLVSRRAKGDGEGFDRALLDTIRYGLTGLLLIAAVCGGGAHAILTLFGPGFARAAPAFVLLIAYPALSCLSAAQTQALLSVDRPGLTSIMAFGRLVVTVGLTVALTPRIGIVGPAIGLLAGYLFETVWKSVKLRPFLNRSLHATWPLRQRLALIAAYVCGFGATRAIERSMPSLGGLLLSLAAGTLAYAAALLIGGGFCDRDRDRLTKILAMARSLRGRTPVPNHADEQPNPQPQGEPAQAAREDATASRPASLVG